MKIGIAAENRTLEKRVVILPSELKIITPLCEVLVEKGAGKGLGIGDEEYEKVGAKIAKKDAVYACDLVVRIKEANSEEIELMKPGSILMCMMHIRCNIPLENSLKSKKSFGIALENIKDPFGKRLVEAVEESGRIGMDYGFSLLKKPPEKSKVTIMGYGNMSRGAIRAAARKFAKVEILGRQHFLEMEKHLPGTDILVDAVNRPFRREVEKETPFVTREMLKLLETGSVIVDLVSNPIGHAPVETMRPTFLDNPFYIVDGIYHTSLWGWPAMEPDTVAKRYSKQIVPFIKEIVLKGLDNVSDPIKNAIVVKI